MTGEKEMYRSREVMEEEGKFKRMRNQTWFKSKRGGVLKRILKDAGNVGEKPELNFLRKLEEQQWDIGDRKAAGKGKGTRSKKKGNTTEQ